MKIGDMESRDIWSEGRGSQSMCGGGGYMSEGLCHQTKIGDEA